jgi:hypothetical protein
MSGISKEAFPIDLFILLPGKARKKSKNFNEKPRSLLDSFF